ncbi:MAG: DUF924 domain-containing protein [Novosphingobium sp.]|nr:DUF924 domain-containing protein [Novosphingobium sp.]
MAAAPRRWAAELLHFWFHKLGPRDWFRGGPEVDEALRKRFERDLLSLFTQSADNFLTDPATARAAVLLFDQVPRNLYRGSAEAFAFDPLARHICTGVLAREWDKGLTRVERQFLGLPLEHSEDIADQRASLAYFSQLDAHTFAFARSHYRMIARFGRFPHRNAALGRTSTPAERAAIAAGNSW